MIFLFVFGYFWCPVDWLAANWKELAAVFGKAKVTERHTYSALRSVLNEDVFRFYIPVNDRRLSAV